MIFLIALSFLLMKRLLLPNSILTEVVIDLQKKVKGGAGLKIENNEQIEPK